MIAGDESGPISPLHDIPLWAERESRVANMIVEVPRWTNAKMEVGLFIIGKIYVHAYVIYSNSTFPHVLRTTSLAFADQSRRAPQPYQARREEGRDALRE